MFGIIFFLTPIAIEVYLLVSIINYARSKFKIKKSPDERTKYKLGVSKINLFAGLAMLLLYSAVMGVALDAGAGLLMPFLWLFFL